MNSEPRRFAEYWKDKGYEKGESQPFWLNLLRDIFNIEHPEEYIKFEDKVKLDHTAFLDGYIDETHVLIEQKSRDKKLDKPIQQSDGSFLTPFEQAKRYSSELPYSKRPRWVITCNFQEFWIYDMERPNKKPEILLLENFANEYYRLEFIIDRAAGPFVLQNADAILEEYPDSAIDGIDSGFVAMLDVVETEFVVKVDGNIGSDSSLSVQFLDAEAEYSEQIQAIREFDLSDIPKGAILKFTTGGTDKKLRIDENANGKTDRVVKTDVKVLKEYKGQ